ncbi:MAG: hypothetical protein CVV27_18960 [Candidatus Melainabacteria bacterium HGW-Melainabacteria-1]|nr:MAG: hypothetical protein CVV27_18960 [Candidatus Melainabacteria bacterium HGW-Melainabacteria-1]
MIRHLLLALWLSGVMGGTALAQSTSSEPTPPPMPIEPESFPTVTPMPAKPPVPASPEPSELPSVQPTTSPAPTATPTSGPTAVPTALPTATPIPGKAELSFDFPKPTEGRRFMLKLQLKGTVSYPVKGMIRFEEQGYDHGKLLKEAVPFELKGPGQHEFSLVFRTPGRKVVRIESAAAPTRNVALEVAPFVASIFPQSIDASGFERDPDLWKVWVNLQHSLSSSAPQRQYYLVTYRGEIVQKLLTSSAAPGKLTPQGVFKLGPKIASPKSTLYDSVMPFWTTILVPGHSFEYGNHGLIGEAYLYSLGVPASHGCLRLSNKWVQRDGDWVNIGGAKWVYTHVPVGTKIQIFKQAVQPFAYENYTMWLARR